MFQTSQWWSHRGRFEGRPEGKQEAQLRAFCRVCVRNAGGLDQAGGRGQTAMEGMQVGAELRWGLGWRVRRAAVQDEAEAMHWTDSGFETGKSGRGQRGYGAAGCVCGTPGEVQAAAGCAGLQFRREVQLGEDLSADSIWRLDLERVTPGSIKGRMGWMTGPRGPCIGSNTGETEASPKRRIGALGAF